ncbi:uncharacterized protein [Paramisgurnus dabryanus]|uniref:uncharacterized protein n=1 Tax=Paramisgurnus dabryanus TaxID=90735 RepID=UPI0031F3CF66
MATWNEQREDQLIALIQERPALYNVTEKCYASRGHRAELWREIEQTLAISEKELRKRWDSLRTQYSRYKKAAPTGSVDAPKTGRQQWILNQLQFLEPHMKRREITSKPNFMEPLAFDDSCSLSPITSNDTWNSNPEEPNLFEAESKPSSPLPESAICGEASVPIKEEPVPCTFSQPSTPRPRMKRRRKMLDASTNEKSANLLHNISKILERLAPQEECSDDVISTYCKSIEHRMRKLPPHLLPHFMHEVDNSIFRYQVLLSSSEHTPNTQPSEIQPLQPISTSRSL